MQDSRHWKILIKALLDKGVDISAITEHSLLSDIGLDSLDLFSIIVRIENEYSIKIEDEELIKIKTVSDALNILKKYIP